MWKGSLELLLKRFGVTLTTTVAQWGDGLRRVRYLAEVDYTEPYDHTEEIDYPCETYAPERGFHSYNYLTRSKKKQISGVSCRGMSASQVERYRLRVGTGGWGERIFIPTLWGGKVTFWVARDYSGETDIKYLNPTDRSRRYHVFNLEQAQEYQDVVITEGVFSAIAAGPNAIATFGKYVTVDQLIQLEQAKFRTYYVALDGDARPQSSYVARWLRSHGCDVRLVILPPTEDPDSVDDFPARMLDAKEYSFRSEVEFLLESATSS
jgi:hypothetical protein